MIDEKKIAEYRKDLHLFDIEKISLEEWTDALDTMEPLWAVARAAKRWIKAAPGRESSAREEELRVLIEDLLNDEEGS